MPNKHKPTGNPRGRPLKFKTLKSLQTKIDAYFKSCKPNKQNPQGEPLTITGLALALDTSRETLLNYEGREEFFDAIKRAKLRVENFAEKQLFTSKSPTGPIFALKNFDWKDHATIAPGNGVIIQSVTFSEADCE